MTTNAQLLFNAIPKGEPTPDTFKYDTENTIDLEQNLSNGACIVKTIVVSLDPYMRGRMRPAEVKSYSPAFELHKPLTGHGVAVVVRAAEDSKYKVGDHVYGVIPYQQYIFFPGEQKVDEETKKFLGPSPLRVIKNEEGLPWVRSSNADCTCIANPSDYSPPTSVLLVCPARPPSWPGRRSPKPRRARLRSFQPEVDLSVKWSSSSPRLMA